MTREEEHVKHHATDYTTSTSGLGISRPARLTAEELERRRTVIERLLRRRERIGPIGIRADELHHIAEADSEPRR